MLKISDNAISMNFGT